MATLSIRFHGTGNAWPVMLGDEHPFYNRFDYRELSNAAYSLIAREEEGIIFDVLVDAGHGTIQSLLSSVNRIPEAICLTHGHLDHTLSVDWVVQSFYRRHNKQVRYPLYCTGPVFRQVLESYPHLACMLDFQKLNYGVPRPVTGTDLEVTAFPVYHGPHAAGASMLLFSRGSLKVLFTGDLLVPMLRNTDYEIILQAKWLIADSNNRFPYPRSNHWSITGDPSGFADYISDVPWKSSDANLLKIPHTGKGSAAADRIFIDEATVEMVSGRPPLNISEFAGIIHPENMVLVHYSGTEDEKYHDQPRLSKSGLKDWTTGLMKKSGYACQVLVPTAGDEYLLD